MVKALQTAMIVPVASWNPCAKAFRQGRFEILDPPKSKRCQNHIKELIDGYCNSTNSRRILPAAISHSPQVEIAAS